MRDSNATLIITDHKGLWVSIGTRWANEWARQHGRPELVIDATGAMAPEDVKHRRPARKRSPGIYIRARSLIAAMLDRVKHVA